jgi:hypothetical protein
MYVFSEIIITNDGSDDHIFNTFCTNSHLISFLLNLNLIKLNLNLIQWNMYFIQCMNSIYGFEFNLSCMQCHSISSFKWNLIFTKSTHCFHYFTMSGSVRQCQAQVNWL